MTLHFFKPNLLTFDNSIRWNSYKSNETLRKEFNRLAKIISQLLSALDIIIVPDLSSVDFFDEEKDLTVNAYRQKANDNKIYAVEIE